MICKNCKSTQIISRKNYSHGKKSKATVSNICKNCGSRDIETEDTNKKRFKRR